jgi:dipeptidyl aminopeptidase/acylaminoacyl peptidase
VYESNLLPTRKRRRASPWVVIPALFVLLALLLYVLFILPRHRRFVATAGEIVFASDQGAPGHPHLWIAGPGLANPHRLSASAEDETSPAWSPDGSQVAFISSQGSDVPQVFVVYADGLTRIEVTHNEGAKSQPQFAPSDNDLIGYLSGGAFSTVDVPTGQTTRLLPTVSENSRTQNANSSLQSPTSVAISAFGWSPTKDPAQQGLAAIEETGISQALAILPTLSSKVRDSRPDSSPLAAAQTVSFGWSPDSGLLAVSLLGVAGMPAGHEASALILLDSQGDASGQRPLILFPSATLGPEHPVFSPDGSEIFGEIWRGADLAHQQSIGLFSVPTDGSAPPHLFYHGSAEDLQFSADGKSLYFLQVRADSGHDLCRISSDGTGFARLSDGKADITGFVISPQSSAHP